MSLLLLLHLIKISKCITLLSAPVLLAVHVVSIAVVPEIVVARSDFGAGLEVGVVLTLAKEALVLTEAVVAHANVSVAVGALPVHEVSEVVGVRDLGHYREELVHVNLVVIFRSKPLPVTADETVGKLQGRYEEHDGEEVEEPVPPTLNAEHVVVLEDAGPEPLQAFLARHYP